MRGFFPFSSPLTGLLTTSLLSGPVDAGFWTKKSLMGSGSESGGGTGSGTQTGAGKYSAANNMMLKMGASTIDTPGAQCTWDGMSSTKHKERKPS